MAAERAPRVLLTAEVVGTVYFRALYHATYSGLLQQLCLRLIRDEEMHVNFQCFTLAQLRAVHEGIVGKAVDPANFRRQVLASGELEETGATQAGAKHRPAKFYRFTSDSKDQR